MIEILPNLFIGNEQDYETVVRWQTGWVIVHACKEPYHRQALGYQTRGAPKEHPEYLIARRDNRLILNLVDAPDPAYIPKVIIDAALECIGQSLQQGMKVLVHCNLGESRAPGIGLLYLAVYTKQIPSESLEEAEIAFRKLYPFYKPSTGMRGFLKNYWSIYNTQTKTTDNG